MFRRMDIRCLKHILLEFSVDKNNLNIFASPGIVTLDRSWIILYGFEIDKIQLFFMTHIMVLKKWTT